MMGNARLLSSAAVAIGAGLAVAVCDAREFTVRDDIEFSEFGDYHQLADPITYSPDRQFFVVATERGRLDTGRPESTLRVYRTADVLGSLQSPDTLSGPTPIWTIVESHNADPQDSEVSGLRWQTNSTGFAYLIVNEAGNQQLIYADVRAKSTRRLTQNEQSVTGFALQDGNHFVFSVANPRIRESQARNRESASIVATGRSLLDLLATNGAVIETELFDQCELWVFSGKRPYRVEEKSSGRPVLVYSEGISSLALSPNGRSLVTSLAVNEIPRDWASAYPPPNSNFPVRIRGGQQKLESFEGRHDVSEFVVVDLDTGHATSLTNTPTGLRAGWSSQEIADWSRDGKWIALSDTFMPPNAEMRGNDPKVPCVAVVDVASGHSTCVESLRLPRGEQLGCCDHYYVTGVQFLAGAQPRLRVEHAFSERSITSVIYARSVDGSWAVEADSLRSQITQSAVDVHIEQDLNTPPRLVAEKVATGVRQVILDPNPQLKDVELARASIFKWKDKAGRDWKGGLYLPPHYVANKTYPLVVQTHGFDERRFEPSGYYPPAFAAQALAANGIVVLQSQECSSVGGEEEGRCNVDGFEAAIRQLTDSGVVDPDHVGVIGFSRTCYHVMKALTTSTRLFKAASITDGVNMGYLQYLLSADIGDNRIRYEAEGENGSAPFGAGLQRWVENSPEFNLNRIVAPLQIVAEGPSSLLMMWEPYAALRYLNKPVDLIVLNTKQHVLTNPKARFVSQGGTVDWFRFWLKDEEDTDPDKTEQYQRWREMRAAWEATKKAPGLDSSAR
jgi:hypothetical protein